jgi:hypothetical protein
LVSTGFYHQRGTLKFRVKKKIIKIKNKKMILRIIIIKKSFVYSKE